MQIFGFKMAGDRACHAYLFDMEKGGYTPSHAQFYLSHISTSSRQIMLLWEPLHSVVFYQDFIFKVL